MVFLSGVTVTEPTHEPLLQVVAGRGELSTVKPSGSASVNPMLVNGVEPVFRMVMVSVDTPPGRIGLGEKLLLTLAPGRLVSEATVSTVLLAPLNEVTPPIGMVFVRLPFTLVVTLRVRMQDPLAGRVPLLNWNELDPVAIRTLGTRPPVVALLQVPVVRLAGEAMIMPTGMLSVKVIPLRMALLGLVRVTLIVDTEPPVTVLGLKSLLTRMVSGVMVRIAWAGATG